MTNSVNNLEKRRIYMREYARKKRAEDLLFVEKQREAGRKSRLKRLEISKLECKNWREKNKEKIDVAKITAAQEVEAAKTEGEKTV